MTCLSLELIEAEITEGLHSEIHQVQHPDTEQDIWIRIIANHEVSGWGYGFSRLQWFGSKKELDFTAPVWQWSSWIRGIETQLINFNFSLYPYNYLRMETGGLVKAPEDQTQTSFILNIIQPQDNEIIANTSGAQGPTIVDVCPQVTKLQLTSNLLFRR